MTIMKKGNSCLDTFNDILMIFNAKKALRAENQQ